MKRLALLAAVVAVAALGGSGSTIIAKAHAAKPVDPRVSGTCYTYSGSPLCYIEFEGFHRNTPGVLTDLAPGQTEDPYPFYVSTDRHGAVELYASWCGTKTVTFTEDGTGLTASFTATTVCS